MTVLDAMTAADVKAALRRRHPAIVELGAGPWTTLEEWMGIDLLAIAAWSKPPPARCNHARIGYEVKVSRSDYRRELLKPHKRVLQVGFCHEFYFAVPEGLLHADEIEFEPPDWLAEPEAFSRRNCDAGCYRSAYAARSGEYGHTRSRPGSEEDDEGYGIPRTVNTFERCERCDGKGILSKSRAELEAPTLWVPADVGLVTITPRGVHVAKKAPLRKPEISATRLDHMLGQLVRWVSVRPDPRHRAVAAGAPIE